MVHTLCLTCLSHVIYYRWTSLEVLIYVHACRHLLIITYVIRLISIIHAIDLIQDVPMNILSFMWPYVWHMVWVVLTALWPISLCLVVCIVLGPMTI
jgi:hypothetical protein